MRRALAIGFLALAAACRSLPFPEPDLQGEYGKALKRWTRKVALYAGLETRAFVRIVYLSPEFVEAQALEISHMRAELPDQAAQTLARLREQYRQPSFYAIVYVPDRNANDWNASDSVWRLALNLGNGERAPDRMQRFETPFSAEQRALYPYIDEYSVAYLIRFPDPSAPPPGPAARPASQTLAPTLAQFIAAGAPGQMRFYWSLNGGPEPPSVGDPGPAEEPAPVMK